MTTKTQVTHTPGPWRVEVNTSQPYLPNTTKIVPVYKVERRNDRTDIWFEEEESKANARLIAAAPELLECLQEIVDDCTTNGDVRLTTVDKCNAAIAKARGQQ